MFVSSSSYLHLVVGAQVSRVWGNGRGFDVAWRSWSMEVFGPSGERGGFWEGGRWRVEGGEGERD